MYFAHTHHHKKSISWAWNLRCIYCACVCDSYRHLKIFWLSKCSTHTHAPKMQHNYNNKKIDRTKYFCSLKVAHSLTFFNNLNFMKNKYAAQFKIKAKSKKNVLNNADVNILSVLRTGDNFRFCGIWSRCATRFLLRLYCAHCGMRATILFFCI